MNYIIRPDNDVLRVVMRALSELHPDKAWEVEIKQHKKNKTRQQERYFHDLLDVILEFQSGYIDKDEKEELKRDMAWRCGFTIIYTPPECEPREIPKKTSGLTTHEYSQLIDQAKFVCADLGLWYPSPKDLGLNIS